LIKYLALNIVLIICTTAIVTPSLTAQEHLPLPAGVCGGLFVSLFLRVPGAPAEWYLSRIRYHWAVYVPYVLSGLFTALVVVTNHSSPYEGDPLAGSLTGTDAVASMTGIYILTSSASLLLVAGTCLLGRVVAGRLTRKYAQQYVRLSTSVRETTPKPAVMPLHPKPIPQPYSSPPVSPLRQLQPQQHLMLPPRIAYRPPLLPQMPKYPPRTQALQRSSDGHSEGKHEQTDARSMRNEIGTFLGILTGLTSLVQGFDTHDIYKTLAPLAIFAVGIAVMYTITKRRS
jgi:hypothetical protein